MGGFDVAVPGPEHEVLAKLTGEWTGTETMLPSPWCPEAQQLTGHISARMLYGFFAISDYTQKAGDEVSFRGHGVYSFDPAEKRYVMYWFDSMGGAGGTAYGTYADGVLAFQNSSKVGHHRYVFTFGEGETRFQMAMSADGETWNELMDSHYRPA